MERLPPSPARRAIGYLFVVALGIVMAACEPKSEPESPATASGQWHEFEGSWDATGTRHGIPLGADRKGSIIDLRGTLLLTGAGRPGVGFESEVIAMVDSETGLVGRGVWTDERGDQIFSELKGEGTREKNHIAGTILGGSGRYAGAIGSYDFSWQFVIEAEDGSIQGRTVGLQGRVGRSQPGAGGSTKP